MDDLIEVFEFPSWPETHSMGKLPWNCNDGTTVNIMNIDTSCGLSGPQNIASMSATPCLPVGSAERQGLSSQDHVHHHHHPEDVLLAARLNQALGFQSVCVAPCLSQSQVDGRVQLLPRGLQESADDILQRLSRGGIFPSTLGVRQCNAESLCLPEGTPVEVHLGKRPWDDEARISSQESMFNASNRGQAQQIRSSGQHPHSQPQGAAVVVGGTAKPRTRARRGQATDPHSIAERLRRERIADRMKSLQELVPNSNKADKALMLDDIIEYVRFLQLQAKVFSMSRLGGTGAIAPLVADVSAEGQRSLEAAKLPGMGGATGASQDYNMAVTEEEVAKLMEADMGSAMRLLQAKGLCLMPISLATAISSMDEQMIQK